MKPGNLLKMSRRQKLIRCKYEDGSNNEGEFRKKKQYQKIGVEGIESNIHSVFKTMTLSLLSTT